MKRKILVLILCLSLLLSLSVSAFANNSDTQNYVKTTEDKKVILNSADLYFTVPNQTSNGELSPASDGHSKINSWWMNYNFG